MAAQTVAVVVCTFDWRRLELVRRCVDSVAKGTRLPESFFVIVDNNPELHEQLSKDVPPSVQVLHNTGRGISDGRTMGLRVADADVVAFIDDDAFAEPTWLAELLMAFEDDEVLAVGGHIEPDWQDPRLALAPELLWVVGSTYRGHPGAGPITRPIGANMAVRREALLALGGFPESFGRAGRRADSNEELAAFSALARRHGSGRIHYVPSATVHHFAPIERCRFRYLMRRSVMEGASKAEARAIFGSDVMGHDRSYLQQTLLPAIAVYAGKALTGRDRAARRHLLATTSVLVVTAATYLHRLALGGVPRALRARTGRLRLRRSTPR